MIRYYLGAILTLLALAVSSHNYYSQPLTAYYDNQNQFFAWDNGVTRKIDYLVPVHYKVGRFALPFLDNARNFKIYSGGVTQEINKGNTNAFFATDYLVAFLNAKILQVWENGNVTRLSTMVEDFYVADSLIMFYDKIQNEFKLYYNNDVYVLEDFLATLNMGKVFEVSADDIDPESPKKYEGQSVASGQVPKVQVSDNIAAYINFADQFKVFYQGDVFLLDERLVQSFGVGRNTVAYVNMMNEFRLFYKGDDILIENYLPFEYQVGDEVCAFVSSDNYFKILYKDSVINVGYFQPEFHVVDNIVYFRDASGYFNVFYKGKIYTLENYWPESIVAHYNSVAYTTRNNMIKLFTEGQTYEVINADVPVWSLNYDVFHYRFGTNLNKVFYKGRTY